MYQKQTTESVETKSVVAVMEMHEVSVGAMRDQSAAIVENVNWTVQPGDYWVVGGLQGSGKSDFLMMAGGLVPPIQGSYRLFGEQMPIFEEARLKERLRLGLVFDNGQLFNHLTVGENVALPLRYHQNLPKTQAEPEVQRILEAFELAPWADSTPGAIGRNWQKRVGLARALVLKPEVLLLDSPLTGLDLRHITWWLGTLDQLSRGHPLLQGRPLTLILTAADLRPWKGRARQFGVLKDKQFMVLGTWEKVEAASRELVQELLTSE
jgi:ABC-type transporter Mla maintaining outer membrane lipid asymmetry ATPase subunit MlaF